VLKSGSTTLMLDKDVGKASLRRKFLIWNLKPAETPLSEITQVKIDAAVDRASGVEVFHTMLVMRTAGLGTSGRKCSRRADEGNFNTGLSWSDHVTLWALAYGHHRTPVHSTRKSRDGRLRQELAAPVGTASILKVRTSARTVQSC
jgi:hypothetical protein